MIDPVEKFNIWLNSQPIQELKCSNVTVGKEMGDTVSTILNDTELLKKARQDVNFNNAYKCHENGEKTFNHFSWLESFISSIVLSKWH